MVRPLHIFVDQIYKKRSLESSETPVLYRARTVPKGLGSLYTEYSSPLLACGLSLPDICMSARKMPYTCIPAFYLTYSHNCHCLIFTITLVKATLYPNYPSCDQQLQLRRLFENTG